MTTKVKVKMLTDRHCLQVLWTIISRVAVDVVGMFRCRELASQLVLEKNTSPSDARSVSTRHEPSSVVRVKARLLAKAVLPATVVSDEISDMFTLHYSGLG